MKKRTVYIESERAVALRKREWRLALVVFLLEWAAGIWMGYRGVLLGDAMSRTANAFYVLYSRPYTLTSMGLVWNPLPSMLQLPFVWASKLWRPLVTKGISMSFVSALFAGWGAKEACKQAKDQGSKKRVYKVWVTGPNARKSHSGMNGERVGIDDKFSNGADWPGDDSLSPEESCGCNCSTKIIVEG